MSLTREIDTPGSPIARFFTEGFPHVQRLDERWASEAGQASTLRPRARGAVDWPMLGTAFGHRVHFAFSRRAPAAVTAGAARIVLDDDPDLEHRLRLRVRAGSGRLTPEDPPPVGVEAFLGRLGDFLQRHQPDGGGGAPAAVLEPVVERRFAQACWATALLENLYRGGLATGEEWRPPYDEDLTTEYLLGLVPEYAIDDLARLAGQFTRRGAPRLLASAGDGSTVAGPVLVTGWADADLVVNGTLIDVKATVRTLPLRPGWVYQLLGYALLDARGALGIARVGVHLGRQGCTVSWPLDELASTLADGAPPPWGLLREQFAALAREAVERRWPGEWARRWRTGPTSHQPRTTGGR